MWPMIKEQHKYKSWSTHDIFEVTSEIFVISIITAGFSVAQILVFQAPSSEVWLLVTPVKRHYTLKINLKTLLVCKLFLLYRCYQSLEKFVTCCSLSYLSYTDSLIRPVRLGSHSSFSERVWLICPSSLIF